jgi:hypothetical protein
MNTIEEVWKDIPWYEWFSASNIWNIKHNIKWNMTKIKVWKWYLSVFILWKRVYLHRLTALSFLGNPMNKSEVNHINWIKNDNRIENLEWVTRIENQRHSYDSLWRRSSQYWRYWKDSWKSKKVKQINMLWEVIKIWDSTVEVKKLTNIHSVSKCCRWEQKTAWWYRWEYL